MAFCIKDKKTRKNWRGRRFASKGDAGKKCAMLNRLKGNRGRYKVAKCR